MTVLAPDYLWSYRCNLKGCCCNAGWRIGLVEDDLERLQRAASGTELAERVAALDTSRPASSFASLIKTTVGATSSRQRPEVGELPKDDDGGCGFMVPDGRCEIHGTLGEAALPRVCQSFPVLAGQDGPVTRTTWELLCPEVARALADATGPARIVPAPGDTARSFIADLWNESDATLPVMGVTNTLSAARHYETVHATAAEATLFRETLALALHASADVPIATIAAALCELNRWARAGAPLGKEALMAALTRPQRGAALRAAMLAVTEAARRRFMIIASEREQVQRTTRLCRHFFAHHPWGTEKTLHAVETAFENPAGPLASIPEDIDTHALFGPAERLVFANAAIAHQNLSSAAGDSLLGGLARSLMILVDALFFRFIFTPADGTQGPTPAEYAATALALADTLHRGKDAGGDFFADLLRHLARSPAVQALAETSTHGDAEGRDGVLSIGAVLVAELRHERAAARLAAGWHGRLVLDWRARITRQRIVTIDGLTTPGLPVTSDAPQVIKAVGTRAEVAILGLGIAVASDVSLLHEPEMRAPLAVVLPEFTPAEVREALRSLAQSGHLAPTAHADPERAWTALDVATRVTPSIIAVVLRGCGV